MATRTQQWITELNTSILKMSSLVEESLQTAMIAFTKLDDTLAERVRAQDDQVDMLEIEIRDQAIKILALQQPMGADLRFITSALSIAHELERVGDRAVNICKRTRRIVAAGHRQPLELEAFQRFAATARNMMEKAINSFVSQDTALAKSVRQLDEDADALCEAIQAQLLQAMQAKPEVITAAVHATVVALNLERIADQATNIAEDVVYLVAGQQIRHQRLEQLPEPVVTRAPLEALEKHARIVLQCVSLAGQALAQYTAGEMPRFNQLAAQVNQKEHEADAVKRNVRGHLPKGIIMPIDKFELFAYVKEQDRIADDAQTLVDWLSLVDKGFTPELTKGVHALLAKCIEAVQMLPEMIRTGRDFFRSSDEVERKRVKEIISAIRTVEHEADAMEMSLKHLVFKTVTEPILLHHQLTTVDIIGKIANHAENSADMMRAMVAR
ncbi:MAG: phosphate signaling complex protein PhoU [Thermodesulfobacteriota bacterium]